MKFKLRKEKGRVAGRHIEKDPETGKDVYYKPGDIIDSERELDKIFRGKFEKVPTAEDFTQTEPNIIDKRFKNDEEEKEALQARLNELNADDDNDEDDTPAEDDNDGGSNDSKDDDDDNDDGKDDDNEYGKDVSDEFPTAAKVDLKVFTKNNTWFNIIDPDAEDGTDPKENEKGLHRKDVQEFLEQYIDDKDDDSDDEDDDNDED
jgi:hypothetical protein